jgi:serine/threonine protein kinase
MQADRDYCREAAAYTELHGPLEGTIIPKYHGSWTCDVSVETPDGPKKRPVRLILMEFIDGVCMEDLDLTGFTKNERSKIMVKTMEAEVAIFFHGVVHRDFAPRNVVIRGNIRSTDLQVVILDFSLAVVIRLAYPIDRRVYKLPPSPILRWSRQFPDFGDWVPPTRETLDEWLWKHWQGSPLYRPVGYGGQNVESG